MSSTILPVAETLVNLLPMSGIRPRSAARSSLSIGARFSFVPILPSGGAAAANYYSVLLYLLLWNCGKRRTSSGAARDGGDIADFHSPPCL